MKFKFQGYNNKLIYEKDPSSLFFITLCLFSEEKASDEMYKLLIKEWIVLLL